jgi:2-keto-4-pentenoate hydratase
MNDAAVREAARVLLSPWEGGTCIQALPHACRPASRTEGYAIQAALQELARETLVGWKIAATGAAGQAHIGVDGPLAGRLLGGRVHASAALLSLSGNRMRVAEPEFAFRMARDLPPRSEPYTTREVVAAAAALHPAIEVPSSRYQDFTQVGAAQLIADNACAHDVVLGEPTGADWRALDLADQAVQADVAERFSRYGTGAKVLGDPRVALAWLANELCALGERLGAGQLVTTGTCMPPVEIQPGDHVTVDFGALGRVEVRFAP